MFDSLADRMKQDLEKEVPATERALRLIAVVVNFAAVFGVFTWSVCSDRSSRIVWAFRSDGILSMEAAQLRLAVVAPRSRTNAAINYRRQGGRPAGGAGSSHPAR